MFPLSLCLCINKVPPLGGGGGKITPNHLTFAKLLIIHINTNKNEFNYSRYNGV
jgi:hypothetical protein